MPITEEQLEHWFTYHKPTGDQPDRYVRLRRAAKAFASAIVAETPPCADQTAAVRKVREAMMTANSAIACDGK